MKCRSAIDRVGTVRLRSGSLPHHRTCGFPHPAVEPTEAGRANRMEPKTRNGGGSSCSKPYEVTGSWRYATHPVANWPPSAVLRSGRVVVSGAFVRGVHASGTRTASGLAVESNPPTGPQAGYLQPSRNSSTNPECTAAID